MGLGRFRGMPYGQSRPERIKRYHARAEELRAMGDGWHYPETLETLLSIADDYDQMASVLERLETADGEATHSPAPETVKL